MINFIGRHYEWFHCKHLFSIAVFLRCEVTEKLRLSERLSIWANLPLNSNSSYFLFSERSHFLPCSETQGKRGLQWLLPAWMCFIYLRIMRFSPIRVLKILLLSFSLLFYVKAINNDLKFFIFRDHTRFWQYWHFSLLNPNSEIKDIWNDIIPCTSVVNIWCFFWFNKVFDSIYILKLQMN